MKGRLNEVQISNRFASYAQYLRKEWEILKADRARSNASIDAVGDTSVSRVLDVGCGAGQEMLPFVSRGAYGFGVDVMVDAGRVGAELYGGEGYAGRVHFLRASGAKLPFPDGFFDVSICRVALSYMDNHATLTEVARVLRPGGKFLLKYAAPAYYWTKFRKGIKQRYLKSSVHAARVLYAGCIYQITGRQPHNRFTAGGEIFQTEATLRREINPLGLVVTGFLPDTNFETPSVVITKAEGGTIRQNVRTGA